MDFSPERVLAFIKSGKNREVEFRYKLSKDDIIEFLVNNKAEYAAMCKLTRTVNFIYLNIENNEKNIVDLVVTKDCDAGQISYTKKKIELRYWLNDSVKVTISTETPATASSKPRNAELLFRVKCRLTIPVGKGRFDITQVAEIKEMSKVEMTKNDLFMPLDGYKDAEEIYDAFTRNMNNSVITRHEFEYEFAPVSEIVADNLSPEYAMELLGADYSNKVERAAVIANLADELGKKNCTTLKRLLNNAIALTAAEYNRIYPPYDWYITPKVDGQTALAIFNREGKSFMVVGSDVYEVPNKWNEYTVLVGELLEDTFYCFDILVCQSDLTIELPFSQRLLKFMHFIGNEIAFGKYKIIPKVHLPITSDLQRSFKLMYEEARDYETDGYVLVSPNNTYYETVNYKVKESNTIDFMIKKPTLEMKKNNIYKCDKGQEVFLLFCTVNEYDMRKAMIQPLKGYKQIFGNRRFTGTMPIQFCPPDDPLAYIWCATQPEAKKVNKALKEGTVIGEMLWDIEKKTWHLLKFRPDRANEPNYYGNYLFGIAEGSWFATKYPLKITEMHKPPESYFNQGKDTIYKAAVGFNSFVKNSLLKQVATMVPNKNVIDLASGKGQDLHRYYSNNYKNVIFCDVDPIALSELVARRFDIIRNKHKNYEMKVQILHRDLNENHEDTLRIFEPLINDQPIGLIVCNLAIHYLIDTIENMKNFIKLIKGIAAPGAIFYFTTMSGKAVFDLLGDANEWVIHENGVVKYRIVKLFEGARLADLGQEIEIKMPFSDTLYKERLVNIEFVNHQFVKYGLKLLSSDSFDTFLPQFKQDNSAVYNLLTEDDKKYVGLYHYSMFQL